MDFIVNDLSFEAQFHELSEFDDAISRIMELREIAISFDRSIYCHRNLLSKEVVPGFVMPRAIQAFPEPKRRALMLWFTKHGPFWEDERTHCEDDYLEHNDKIVTDSAIGEAAYCCLTGADRGLVSLVPSSWEYSPIPVVMHRDDDTSELIEVENHWTPERLTDRLSALPSNITTWESLEQITRMRFVHLEFVQTAFSHLSGLPFNPATRDRILTRLKLLDDLKTCFDADGRRTARGFEIINQYFSGDGAYFSDSSDGEKAEFRSRLTFAHPTDECQTMFCTWHGKVRGTPPIRIHFTWPVRANEPLYVVYIGPKITRR